MEGRNRMAILNDRNEKTKGIIHLMITAKCDRNCPNCCNNQYSLDDIPVVTDEELQEAHTIYLTGGEPFAYGHPTILARRLKNKYPNIETVRVYTNAFELGNYLTQGWDLDNIDGLTISIKDNRDKYAFENIIIKAKEVLKLKSNWVYVFSGFEDIECPNKFNKKVRQWQKNFVAAPNSIFRKIPKMDK
jgi:molybdenum cofactor biosynthesis enzyme MoaA